MGLKLRLMGNMNELKGKTTFAELSRKTGVDRRIIRNFLNGDADTLTGTIDRIAEGMGWSIEKLTGTNVMRDWKADYNEIIDSLAGSLKEVLDSVLEDFKDRVDSILSGLEGSGKEITGPAYGAVMRHFIVEIIASSKLDTVRGLLDGSITERGEGYHVPPRSLFPLGTYNDEVFHISNKEEIITDLDRVHNIAYEFLENIDLAKKTMYSHATSSAGYAKLFDQPDNRAIVTAGDSSAVKGILKAASDASSHSRRIVVGVSAGVDQPPIRFEGVGTCLDVRSYGYQTYLLQTSSETFQEELERFLETHRRRIIVALFGFEAIITQKGKRAGSTVVKSLISNVGFLNMINSLKQIDGRTVSVCLAGECYKIMDPVMATAMLERLPRDYVTEIPCSQVDYLITDDGIHKKDKNTGEFEISCCKRRKLSKFGWW